MNSIEFNIDNWLALSPGIITQEDWVCWSKANNKWPSDLCDVPANLIKPMMRRRMSSLSKLAVQAALQISSDEVIDYIVFSSRHGELIRTVKLIEDIVKGEEASPMAFSQSVHNTAAGLFTINSNRATPVTSIAAVESTLHHALIEAAIYLHEHPLHKVLVVDFDEPLPVQYKKDQECDALYYGYAFSALLSAGDKFKLSWCKSDLYTKPTLPQTFSVIDLLLNKKQRSEINDKRFSWFWCCK
jgi:hypothetical protein